MTLPIRRVLLNSLFVSAIIGVLAVVFVWYDLIKLDLISSFSPPTTKVWWGITRAYTEKDLAGTLFTITVYLLLSLFGEIGFRKGFGFHHSSELFFLRLFLLLLPLQAARLILPFNTDMGIASTRIAWFGRFAGITALLNIGLYSSNMPLRQSGYVLGMGALTSLAIAVLIPLDITQPMGNLLYRTSIDKTLTLSCLSLEFLAIVSMAGTSINRMNNRYYPLVLFLLFIIIGSDLSFFGDITLAIIGTILMTVGVIGFSWMMHKIYQWL